MRGAIDMMIRRTTPDDAIALMRLASLDSQPPFGHDALVAVVDGEIRAAVSLADGRAIANPFEHTAELVELLRMRAEQLETPAAPGRSWLARLLPQRGATADA
jgi:hypothetical protein